MRGSRIGQVVLSSNTTVETEIPAMLTSRYTRFPDERFTPRSARTRTMYVAPERLKNMDVAGDRCALRLSNTRCDVVVYTCLVATMSRDRGYHRVSQECLARIIKQNNTLTPVLSPVEALIDTIHVQGYKKVAIIMPHMKSLMQTMIDCIEDSGIEVTDSVSLEVSGNLAMDRLDPANLVDHADRLNVSGADAVVLSICVQMLSLPSIQVVEDRLDRPVSPAVTSTVRQTPKTLGLKAKAPSVGYLLSGIFWIEQTGLIEGTMTTTSIKMVAILDDHQGTAHTMADQPPVKGGTEIAVFGDYVNDEDCTVERLHDRRDSHDVRVHVFPARLNATRPPMPSSRVVDAYGEPTAIIALTRRRRITQTLVQDLVRAWQSKPSLESAEERPGGLRYKCGERLSHVAPARRRCFRGPYANRVGSL